MCNSGMGCSLQILVLVLLLARNPSLNHKTHLRPLLRLLVSLFNPPVYQETPVRFDCFQPHITPPTPASKDPRPTRSRHLLTLRNHQQMTRFQVRLRNRQQMTQLQVRLRPSRQPRRRLRIVDKRVLVQFQVAQVHPTVWGHRNRHRSQARTEFPNRKPPQLRSVSPMALLTHYILKGMIHACQAAKLRRLSLASSLDFSFWWHWLYSIADVVLALDLRPVLQVIPGQCRKWDFCL